MRGALPPVPHGMVTDKLSEPTVVIREYDNYCLQFLVMFVITVNRLH
jgi:hypothetical protein